MNPLIGGKNMPTDIQNKRKRALYSLELYLCFKSEENLFCFELSLGFNNTFINYLLLISK